MNQTHREGVSGATLGPHTPIPISTQASTLTPPPPMGWTNQGDSSYPTAAPPVLGLAALGISDAAVHAFAAVL